jgi:hypothetical protein
LSGGVQKTCRYNLALTSPRRLSWQFSQTERI